MKATENEIRERIEEYTLDLLGQIRDGLIEGQEVDEMTFMVDTPRLIILTNVVIEQVKILSGKTGELTDE